MAGISDASRQANGSALSEIRFRRLASSAVIRLRIYIRLLRIVFTHGYACSIKSLSFDVLADWETVPTRLSVAQLTRQVRRSFIGVI